MAVETELNNEPINLWVVARVVRFKQEVAECPLNLEDSEESDNAQSNEFLSGFAAAEPSDFDTDLALDTFLYQNAEPVPEGYRPLKDQCP